MSESIPQGADARSPLDEVLQLLGVLMVYERALDNGNEGAFKGWKTTLDELGEAMGRVRALSADGEKHGAQQRGNWRHRFPEETARWASRRRLEGWTWARIARTLEPPLKSTSRLRKAVKDLGLPTSAGR